jgi:hypothetical protein
VQHPRRDSLTVAIGLALGLATRRSGRSARHTRAGAGAGVFAASVLAASFAGEAVLFALLVHHPGRAGTYRLAVAMALPFLMLRRARERFLAVVTTAFLAGVALVVEGGVFAVTRYVG